MADISKLIVIDTETTGLKPGYDEVLSLSVIDGSGNVLFDDYIKPATRKRWPNAAKINGITWADVKDKPTLSEREGEILALFKNAELVVGYNVEFDMRMLRANGLNLGYVKTFDVMKEFAKTRENGKWVKLIECAERYGYEFDPHDSLNDVTATLHCYGKLLNDPLYLNPPNTKPSKRQRSSKAVSEIDLTDTVGKYVEAKVQNEQSNAPEGSSNAGCAAFVIFVLFMLIAIWFVSCG